MRQFTFARSLTPALVSDESLPQAYIGLCCRKEWGEDWKGIKLTRLYILLRELFVHLDDPWCTATIKWWNEFRVFLCSSSSCAHNHLGKYSAALLKPMRIHRK